MDKHINEIELFELANNLINDLTQLKKIEDHISNCESCSLKLESEKNVNDLIAFNLQVDEKIDVSQNIINHFSEKPVVQFFDYNWILYTILSMIGFLAVLQLNYSALIDSFKGINIPQIPYLNIIFAAVVSILFMDLLLKYFKNRKQRITA
jgi:hypothetical protein